MAISNTSVLIKRSSVTATPTTLKAGELAVSYTSNNIFIGSPTGDGALPIGGYNTYTAVNNATNANTASTIVRRDGNGSFSGRLIGNADTASTWQVARTIGVSGDATGSVSIDGDSNQNIPVTLSTVATAGTFGSATSIPTITIAANGRVTSVTTNSISTSFTVTGNSGTGSQAGGGTLTISGGAGSGIVSTVTGAGGSETVTLTHDTTVLRSNTQTVGSQVIQTDLTITGNLTVTGSQIYVNTTSLNIADPLIYLAANNYTSDTVDIGVVANYYDGTTERHTGLFRDPALKQWFVFDNYIPELSSNNVIDRANTSFRLATLNANLTSGMVSGLANTIGIQDGGTNNKTYTNNQITYYNGSAIVSLANTGTAGTYGSPSYTQVVTTDGFGRVSSVSNTQIGIDASQLVSGTSPIVRGGTNNNTFTTGGLVVFDGVKLASFANATFTQSGTLTAANTITSLTVDAYGRVTAATSAAIAIDTSQITSGTLGVARGGTGLSTVTLNGITFGNGTGNLGVTVAAGSSDQTWSNQFLTVTNAGVPVWSSAMDGGTF